MDENELIKAVKMALENLAPPESVADQWQIGFQMARKIRKVVFHCGFEFETADKEPFLELVVRYAEEHQLDAAEMHLQFSDSWDTVLLPEDMRPVEFAYQKTIRSSWRMEVQRERYDTDLQHEDAEFILTVFLASSGVARLQRGIHIDPGYGIVVDKVSQRRGDFSKPRVCVADIPPSQGRCRCLRRRPHGEQCRALPSSAPGRTYSCRRS